jgi:Sulfotransferase family
VVPDVHRNRIPVTPAQTVRSLFVLSVVRSGSSLLYSLLNQHSQIALLYEADLPTMQLFMWRQFRSGGWRERWEFWNQGPSRNGIAIESLPTNVSDVWEATRLTYQAVARRKQATIGGEKSPFWCDCALQVAEKFPDALFIFLWRDLNDVMESIARAANVPAFGRLLARPAKVLLANEKLRDACDVLKAQGRRVHEVNYEDLTANTSECMQQICHFLDVPFEARITSLEGADRSAIFSGQHHAMVRGDRIVGERKRAEVLPPAVRAKVGRYIRRWKLSYDGKWPKYPLELPQGTRPLSLVEYWRDRIMDQSLLFWDKVVIVILHQLRPLVYPKKYVRLPEVAS